MSTPFNDHLSTPNVDLDDSFRLPNYLYINCNMQNLLKIDGACLRIALWSIWMEIKMWSYGFMEYFGTLMVGIYHLKYHSVAD